MINAVLFDFDGTLTKPGALDFASIRRAIGCPLGTPILEHIAALPDPDARARAMATLDRRELEAARRSESNEGAEDLIRLLAVRGIRVGILSRNSRASILEALRRFPALAERDFATIISREDDCRPKPHPDGVLLAASRLGCPVRELLVVGDYRFDIEAGARAGARTALLTNGTPPAGAGDTPGGDVVPDHVIRRLAEVAGIVDRERATG